jgi:hypothetical protein
MLPHKADVEVMFIRGMVDNSDRITGISFLRLKIETPETDKKNE